jgi:clan AA aspartic protease
LTWSFADETLLVPIELSNPFLDTHYPPDGSVMAVLDTGFTGFLLVPNRIFSDLRLDELKPIVTTGQLADGTSIQLRGAYGSFRISELDFMGEGLIETTPSIGEIILGIRGMKRLRTLVDGCRRLLVMERC